MLNGEKIEPQRYVELREKDVLKFGEWAVMVFFFLLVCLLFTDYHIIGMSTREYVLLHEASNQTGGADDGAEEEDPEE